MKNYLIISTFAITCVISSCSPVVYAPVGQNVPLLRNKGEVAVTASLATTGDASGLGIQFASALDSSFAFITSLYLMGNKEENSNEGDWIGKGNYFELGGGKFGTLGGRLFHYELFAGLGFGGIKNSFGDTDLNASFIKPFIQPSIGLRNTWVDFALTPRLAYFSYTNHTINTSDQFLKAEARDYFEEKKNSIVFEPGVTIRVGYKAVKAQLQFTGTTHDYEPETYISINNTYFSLGLNWFISKEYR